MFYMEWLWVEEKLKLPTLTLPWKAGIYVLLYTHIGVVLLRSM